MKKKKVKVSKIRARRAEKLKAQTTKRKRAKAEAAKLKTANAANTAKDKTPQPRALIDSVVLHFPLFSAISGTFVRAKNGVAFWQYGQKHRHWYTSIELSRFESDGRYTPPIRDAKPYEQNNINVPTFNGILSAFDRVYDGYVDVIFPSDRTIFAKLTSDPKYYENYTTRITRLDVAFDLPLDLIPTPGELLYYISHGIGCGSRYFNVAAQQGFYFYSKKTGTWTFDKRNPDGSTERITNTQPYFMRNAERLRKAFLTNEITIYIGTRNGEIKIYRKGELIRYELSLKKSILRKLLTDRRPEALLHKATLLQLFNATADRIGVLFAHGTKKEMFDDETRKAIDDFLQHFDMQEKAKASYPESAAPIYNNVIILRLAPLQERERPPPFSLFITK